MRQSFFFLLGFLLMFSFYLLPQVWAFIFILKFCILQNQNLSMTIFTLLFPISGIFPLFSSYGMVLLVEFGDSLLRGELLYEVCGSFGWICCDFVTFVISGMMVDYGLFWIEGSRDFVL